MIYVLIGGIALALTIWLGRQAMPKVGRREWRIAAGGLSALAILGGVAAALRGSGVIGGVLILGGLALAFGARRNTPHSPARPEPGVAEARAILGVGADAGPEEIQAAYSRLMRLAHPDKGGTTGLAAQLNAARDKLLAR
jgi:hypothetical protein